MQQESPQIGPPTLPPPSVPPQSPPPAPQQQEEQNFYRPQNTEVSHMAPGISSPYTPPSHPEDDILSWEASEYVHIDKGRSWLIGLTIIVLILVGISLWLQEWTFAVLVVVMGVAMGVFAFRRPHVLHYTLTHDGVQIADKLYHYKDFRAFGILEDGAFYTMTLIPVKRFAPALSVYFAEPQGDKIVDIVGEHLPMEKIESDLIDVVMRRLRF